MRFRYVLFFIEKVLVKRKPNIEYKAFSRYSNRKRNVCKSFRYVNFSILIFLRSTASERDKSSLTDARAFIENILKKFLLMYTFAATW